jgi:hypothetical protein
MIRLPAAAYRVSAALAAVRLAAAAPSFFLPSGGSRDGVRSAVAFRA